MVALLAVLLGMVVLLAAGNGVLLIGGATTRSADYVGGTASIQHLLDRRADAVEQHDEKAFLAGVDHANTAWLAQERVEYDNLVALKLSRFTLTLEPFARYPASAAPPSLSARFDGRVQVLGVTIDYAVSTVDDDPVAAPWVPVFGYRDGHWLIAGESTTDKAPDGIGGLPWEAAPITVAHGDHVTIVMSTDDAGEADDLLAMAETARKRVDDVYPSDWSGRVLVTAVTDASVFRAYLGDDPDDVDDTLAVTVPAWDAVPEWDSGHYVTSRVILNPEVLGYPDELQHTLTHEFTHAATGAVTSGATPLWLVEGFAEYVAYATDDRQPSLGDIVAMLPPVPDKLPVDHGFYDDASNYVLGWQACVYLAKTYGRDDLIRLYRFFKDGGSSSGAFQTVLGVSESSFTASWRSYLNSLG